MDNQMMYMVLVGVGALAIAMLFYVIVAPYLSGERRAEKRLEGIADAKSRSSGRAERVTKEENNNRRAKVAETIKELEDREKQRDRVTMRMRLDRAGLAMDARAFWVASLACGGIVGGLAFVAAPTLNPIFYGAAFIIGTLGVPRWVVNRMIKTRQKKFLDEFANAIDVIVRGVKSGLPLNECLGIIARESPEPIRSEISLVVEQQRVGVPLTECFERLMARVPLPEVRFFAIVIGIQQQAGGNLSEALGNLSGVLRDRKRMLAKVKALSAEAKASAGVLGSLPIVVMVLVYLTSPDYISLLWQKTFGQFLLAVGAALMTCGVVVMRKMINFKF
jgi:tight adherence protein B